MSYQTLISINAIDEDEFCDLVNRLAKVSGQSVEFEKQLVISTDSEDLHSILASLTDAIRSGEPAGDVVRKNGHAKRTLKREKLGGVNESKSRRQKADSSQLRRVGRT